MIKSSLKFFALALGLGAFVFGASSCKKDDAKSCCSITENGETTKVCEGDSFYGVKLTGDLWTEAKKSLITDGYTCD